MIYHTLQITLYIKKNMKNASESKFIIKRWLPSFIKSFQKIQSRINFKKLPSLELIQTTFENIEIPICTEEIRQYRFNFF